MKLHRFGVSQTRLGANVPSGLVPSTFFRSNFWAFQGPCVRGRGCPWYDTSTRPESTFTCSSPRCAPRVVPSTFFLNYFWAFLGGLGRGEGAPLVRYLCRTHRSLHGKACLRNADRYMLSFVVACRNTLHDMAVFETLCSI